MNANNLKFGHTIKVASSEHWRSCMQAGNVLCVTIPFWCCFNRCCCCCFRYHCHHHRRRHHQVKTSWISYLFEFVVVVRCTFENGIHCVVKLCLFVSVTSFQSHFLGPTLDHLFVLLNNNNNNNGKISTQHIYILFISLRRKLSDNNHKQSK